MPIAIDYDTWQEQMQAMLGLQDPNGTALFATVQSQIIDYAELRCYRDLQLLDTSGMQSVQCVPGNRVLAVPAGSVVVLKSANVLLPPPLSFTSGVVRVPLRRASKMFIDAVCPGPDNDPTQQGPPIYYDFFQSTTIILGPAPDQNYLVQLMGTMRPLPLGNGTDPTQTQTTTLLTQQFPDLFLAASMIFGSGYIRNFGAQSDDPKMALSWEGVYQSIKGGASLEEAMKRGQTDEAGMTE